MCLLCERAKETQGQYDSFYAASGSALNFEQKVQAEQCASLKKTRIPCVILCGFLGAGKTTLLNRIIKENKGRRIAVIENEVGEASVDDKLIENNFISAQDNEPQVVLMSDGCMCCRTRGDLINAFKKIVETSAVAAKQKNDQLMLDGVILELSGLSDLAPVVQTFFADSFVQASLRLDLVVCVLGAPTADLILNVSHAQKVNDQLDGDLADLPPATAVLMREQLSLADLILVNKCDSIPHDKVVQISASISHVNDKSLRHYCVLREDIELAADCSALGISTTLPVQLQSTQLFLNEAFSLEKIENVTKQQETQDANPEHNSKNDYDHEIHDRHQHKSDRSHIHDRLGFTALSMVTDKGPLDLKKFKAWMERVAMNASSATGSKEQLVRYKGILSCVSQDTPYDREKIVLQGLYGHVEFSSQPDTNYYSSPSKSELVCIGRLGDGPGSLREELEQSFNEMIVLPDLLRQWENAQSKFDAVAPY